MLISKIGFSTFSGSIKCPLQHIKNLSDGFARWQYRSNMYWELALLPNSLIELLGQSLQIFQAPGWSLSNSRDPLGQSSQTTLRKQSSSNGFSLVKNCSVFPLFETLADAHQQPPPAPLTQLPLGFLLSTFQPQIYIFYLQNNPFDILHLVITMSPRNRTNNLRSKSRGRSCNRGSSTAASNVHEATATAAPSPSPSRDGKDPASISYG